MFPSAYSNSEWWPLHTGGSPGRVGKQSSASSWPSPQSFLNLGARWTFCWDVKTTVCWFATTIDSISKGLRLVSQLRDEIFLLLHSALQLHYLKVAKLCRLKFEKKAKGSYHRSTMHPSLRTFMGCKEHLTMKGRNRPIWNYQWPTDPLTDWLTGVGARRCYRI